MIKIIDYTPRPIEHIGKMAGICWNANVKDNDKNYDRGYAILKAGHGEPIEFPDITFEAAEYSIRVFRELLRHRHTTKLQESTRYINEKDFEYYIPEKIKENKDILMQYCITIEAIRKCYEKMLKEGITKEDAANILPLATHSRVIMKVNLRELIHIFGLRLCGKAYAEIREMMKELREEIKLIDKQWEQIAKEFLAEKCLQNGRCTEEKPCGLI
jgi:thymidylate synthase (FAD)